MPPSRSAPLVRLDSFDPERGARSFRFSGLDRILSASTLADVVPVLDAAQRAADDGLHAVGWVAYEAAPALDPALAAHPPAPGLPLAWFALFGERHEVSSGEGASADADGGESADGADDADGFQLGPWEASVSEAAYAAQVGRVREWIAAGDTYQVNHTFRLRGEFGGDDEALYERLCRAQRAAYCALIRVGGVFIVSASPELFFRRVGDALEMRPMKGTRPRGRWAGEDEALAAELVASPKERAENLMIVDLLRNDAGRVSRFGSVRVPALFEVERYETVHQLTSTIRSELRPGVGLAELFRALFPCGSVTGAPKVRTSQIIRELEDSPRGVYTGAIGMVSGDEAVFSVAIRTLVIDRGAGRAELGVGSGVTIDSDASSEYRECLDKAGFARHRPRRFRLLETMLWEPGAGFFLLDGHLERMRASARYFGFRWDEAEVRASLTSAVGSAPVVGSAPTGGEAPARVRLMLSRGGGVAVEVHPLAPPSAEDEAPPLRVAFSAERIDSGDVMLYHKTTLREPYDRRRAARPDVDDVLLVNERGEVSEATLHNLVLSVDGEMRTPRIGAGLLPGVFRAELLRRGEVVEAVVTAEDVARADALWLVNSVRGWRRAVLVP